MALPWPEPGPPSRGHPFGVRLHRYGIDAHSGRNTGRFALAGELLASVLADLTGISISTADRSSHWAKRDWAVYLGRRTAGLHVKACQNGAHADTARRH